MAQKLHKTTLAQSQGLHLLRKVKEEGLMETMFQVQQLSL
jgi:hypothetical protein